jgi:uncharacterized spore protein YtfJ
MVMANTFNTMVQAVDKYQEQSREWMDRLLAAAKPRAVYGEPVTSGNYTVITASEVTAGGGFGYGFGGGSAPASTSDQTPGQEQENAGGGVGIGGGGGSSGRPVAAIIVGPDGVRVEPVVDATKIALAVFTTVGAMGLMLGRMRRMSQRPAQ